MCHMISSPSPEKKDTVGGRIALIENLDSHDLINGEPPAKRKVIVAPGSVGVKIFDSGLSAFVESLQRLGSDYGGAQ